MVMGSLSLEAEVAIIGAGPGGYVAAIRAADLGLEVVLIDDRDQRGGVCLIEGCIPSKTLIHAVEVANSAAEAGRYGLTFGPPEVDVDKLREYSQSVVSGLTGGIDGLLKRRGVQVLHGRAHFTGPKGLALEDGSSVSFEHCIIATGSRPRRLPFGEDLPLWSSTEAVALTEVPERLAVVGGGYIGLELGLVYAGLGSKVTVVESMPELLVAADPDLVEPVLKHCRQRFEDIQTSSRVDAISRGPDGQGFHIALTHTDDDRPDSLDVDQVLVSIGRQPNTEDLGLETLGLTPNAQGQLDTNERCQTALPTIYAIGDVAPGPMLAHKASREAKVAAEVIAGEPSAFDNRAVPAVVFTSPEIAWAGLTEREAAAAERNVTVGRFPLRALGRARTLGATDGLVKILCDPETQTVLGVGIVAPQASDLIAEGVLAIEMGATLEDLMVTIHPHPTLSEAIMEAAEVAAGAPIHLPPPRK